MRLPLLLASIALVISKDVPDKGKKTDDTAKDPKDNLKIDEIPKETKKDREKK